MLRGEVWWARFDEQHPVVLLSDSSAGSPHDERGVRAVQVVSAAGVEVGGLGLEVSVATIPGLPSDAVVRVAFPRPGFVPCTWVTTIGPDDLVECIGTLTPAKLTEIDEALTLADQIVSTDDAGHAKATATLAAIRESLRRGTMATGRSSASDCAKRAGSRTWPGPHSRLRIRMSPLGEPTHLRAVGWGHCP